MLKRLPSYFSILAALTVILLGFAAKRTPYEIIIRLVIVIIIAYLTGFLLQLYLNKKVFPKEDNKDVMEDSYITKNGAHGTKKNIKPDYAEDEDFIG